MEVTNKELLIKIAQLYYIENLNQTQISKAVGIHRSTISRLLKEARDKGIVTVKINSQSDDKAALAKKIEEKYQISKVIIVPVTSGMNNSQINSLIVNMSLDYLRTIISNDMVLGFSWGNAMAALSQGFNGFNLSGITCIPLIGGPSGRVESDYHVNTITYNSSKGLNGKALLIDAPAFPENSIVQQSLMNDAYNKNIFDLWGNIDIAFFGIGSPLLKKSNRWQEFYGKDIIADIIEDDVAGDIVSRFFDYSGVHIDNPLDETLIGIPLENLLNIKYRVCIAEDTDKTEAVKAALQGGYINILLTTQTIANQL